MTTNDTAFELLKLTMTPGIGPVLARRLLDRFGAVDRIIEASATSLEGVPGIGSAKAEAFARALPQSAELAAAEMALAERLGVRLVAIGTPMYPRLLSEVREAPPVLYIRGALDPAELEYPVAMVGSRKATAYGIEQAERFAGALSQAGLTIVSGGARGIDSAAHRATVRAGGRTVAVLGCGLACCYPPENAPLFDEIVAAGGAIVSELPLRTSPAPENFPARNRIISGLSLGVLVIEAPIGSGALITARQAIEDQGREVMAVPGRIDSPTSQGCNELLKRGEASLVTCPADVIAALESPARHHFVGTHDARFGSGVTPPTDDRITPRIREARSVALTSLTDRQRQVYEALTRPQSIEDVCLTTGLDAGVVRSEATILEMRGLINRSGSTFRQL